MPLSRPYKIGLDERLKEPEYAAAYLNAAEKEGVFLLALRDVAEVHKISKVAEAAGVNRESLYRTLSAEGNPTRETLKSVLDVLRLEHLVIPKASSAVETIPSITRYSGRTYRSHSRRRKKRYASVSQSKFSFLELNAPAPQISNLLAEMPGIGCVRMGNFGFGELQSASATSQIHSLFLNQDQSPATIPPDLLVSAATGANSRAHI